MRTTLLALALPACTLPVGAAFAQTASAPAPAPSAPTPMRGGMGGMGGGMGGLMRADANGDGIITRDEAVASADARFDALDVNHDGSVSADEMRSGMPPMAGAAPAMPAMQPLTRQQFHDRALRQFDRMDANHDGKVDQAEIDSYRTAMRERRRERQGGDAPQAGQQ